MGARCDRKGLQDGVPGKASVQRNYEVPHSEGQIIKRSVIKRSGRYVSKVCYTQGNFRLPERVLFENLPGAKEKRKVASSDKFKAIKPISEKTALQDVNPSRCDSGGRAGRLADFSGSEGCLLPCPGTPFSVEIPEILCGKRHVRVQSLTFRDNDCASCFHQNVGAGGGTYQEGDRSIHISIPGRLLGEGQGKVVLGLQVQGDGPVHVGCRSSDKLGEVGFNPITGHGSYRVEVDDEGGDGFRSGRSDRSNNSNRYDGPEENGSVSRIVPQAARMSKQRHIPGRVGQVVPTADSAISSVILASQLGNVGGFHSGSEFSQETSGLVAEQEESRERFTVVPFSSKSRIGNGCQPRGLGSIPVGRRGDQRIVVPPGEESSHQLLGDVGSFQCSEVLPGNVECGGHYTSQERQHDGSNVCQQARGDQIVHAMFSDMGPAQLVQGSQPEVDGSLRTGGEECSGGPLFPERTSPRMVLMPSGSGRSVSTMGAAPGGSVREPVQQQVAPILLSGERSQRGGARCADDELGRDGGIRVSAAAPHKEGAFEGKTLENQDDPDSSQLGKETVDVHAHGPSHRRSSSSAGKRKASKDARPVGVSPRSAASKFSCLEDRRRRLREKGFREETAELATGDIRKSTEFCYNARVKVFVNWCHKNGVKDPISSPLASVCNFLQEIFREGKASKTVGGYIAALSKWHRRIHGRKLCDIEEVANIRKATVIARPPRKINFQSWSLPLVLDSLFQEPYEPLEGAQLKFLAHKTVFLVAVSTARRSSELGALSVDKSRFFVKPQGIEVGYVPGFIPKNARMSYAGKTIVIPKFEDMASCEEERLLCPVRAVKCYKRRMDLLRKSGEKRLFITYGNGEKQGCGASKKTIARWITDTIKFAYSNASEDTQRLMKIKAHSVRAAATTYAVLKGVEVRHILEAADWATPTTFIDYYFRPGTGPGQEFATSVLKSASR